VLFLKREKNTKTLQSSLAKAPKMQRIKIHFDRRAGVTVQSKKKKKSNSKVKWKVGVYYVQIVLPIQYTLMSTDSDPKTKTA